MTPSVATLAAMISAMAAYVPWGAGSSNRGYNVGWGDGFLPFVLIGVPVFAFLVWFEVARRRRKR